MATTDKLLNGSGLSHLASTIKSELADKQDELVSGTNIKTINNNSILGSGNIAITADDPSVAVSTTEPTGNEVVWINPNGSADTLATVATTGDYNDLSNKLTAGENITIVTDSEGHNTISASGGGASDWDNLTNKPFESIGTGLSVDSEGNLNAEGGGSSYTFTNGLTESSGTVSWNLNDNIKIFEDTTTTEPNKGLIVNTSSIESTLKTYGECSIAFGHAYGDYNTIEAGSRQTYYVSYPPKGNLAFGWVHGGTYANQASIKALGTGSLAIGHAEGSSSATTSIAVESSSGGTGIAAGYARRGTIKAQANGGAAFALGFAGNGGAVQATGNGSLAVGYSYGSSYKLTASGEGSFAIGEASSESAALTASGKASFAQGRGVQATGFGSVAHGYKSICSGNFATANGFRSKASSPYQFVIGRDNIEDTQSQYYFIIGNGTADNARSNALTVDTSGNLVCNNIPAPPSSDGTYNLQCTVSSGVATYSWVAV